MRVDRYSWWTHWREIADYMIPRRYKWLITPNQGNRGSPINQRIIDNTATIALRICAAGMMSGITSPGREWFKLGVDNEDLGDKPEVKLWLAEVQRRMLRVFAESNFYNGMATMYGDLASFGTAPMIIDEDYEDIIRVYNPCAGEYFLSNSSRMQVDTLYREFVLTTYQVAQRFGLENCSPTVKEAIRNGGAALTREIKIGHAIEPNDNKLLAVAPHLRNMPYRDIYWELGGDRNTVLQIRGVPELKFVAPRWDMFGNDAYGRSPGMDALGDIKMLQIEQKRKAQAIDKHVNPPMVADMSMKNEPASLLPGGVTYVPSLAQGKSGFAPAYTVAPDFSGLVEDIKEVQERIKVTYFNDLFMMISQLDTVRTATEIDSRKEEKLIQLGPVLERFENEALDPAIDRTFNIMLRKDLFPPIPAALRGQHITVRYISMLAEAQKAVTTSALERLAQFTGNLAGAVPNVLDNIDFDEMVDEYAEMLGVSPKVLRALKQVQQIRAQRQQQQAQQQAVAQTTAGAQGAQVLSQTDVGGGKNALQAMMGN